MRQLARGGALNLVGAAVSSGVNVLLVVAIARGVSQSQAGRFFAATSVFLLVAMVAKLGANTGLVYFIARMRALGRPDLVGNRLRAALLPVFAASTLLGAALWVFAEPIADLSVKGETTQTTAYIKILAVFLPMAALADVTLAATRGFRKMRPTVVSDLVTRPLMQLTLTVVVLAVDAPLAWLAVAWAGPYVPELIAAVLWLRSIRRQDTRPTTSTESTGFATSDFWRYTWPRTITSVVHLAMQRLGIIMVAALLGPAPAAVFTAATRFLVVGQLGNQALSTVIQPRLSELLALRDRSGAESVYRVATAWVVLITWPIYLLVIVFSTQFLSLFGSSYSGATEIVTILAVAMLLKTVCGMVDVVLNMAGYTALTLINSLIGLAAMIGLNLLLVPRWGIAGGAVAWAAAIVINNLLPLVQTIVTLRIHPFGAGTWRAVLLAGACFGALPFLVRWLAGSDTTWVLVAVIVGAIAYAAGCYRLRRSLALDALRELWRRRTARPIAPAAAVEDAT